MTVTISRVVLFGGQESLSRGGHIRKLGGRGRINWNSSSPRLLAVHTGTKPTGQAACAGKTGLCTSTPFTSACPVALATRHRQYLRLCQPHELQKPRYVMLNSSSERQRFSLQLQVCKGYDSRARFSCINRSVAYSN